MNPIVAVLRANTDRILGWVLIAVGGISVVVGWVQVSGATGRPGAQVSYLVSDAFTGLLLVLAGVSALLTADLADRSRAASSLPRTTTRTSSPARPGGRPPAEPCRHER